VTFLNTLTVANELVKVHGRGVAVRVVTDAKVAGTKYSMDDFLAKEGIPVRAVKVRAGSMHLKFVLIDGRTLFAGSANLTNDANYRNHEFMVATEDPALIERFAAKFEELWPVGKKQTGGAARRTPHEERGFGGEWYSRE
jgi:phosphatidylserine/phosphatidylglycerophosphate/cardiolipin synthase-like enzyme